MSIIRSFAESGFWDFRNRIVPLAAGIPLMAEGIYLVHHVYQKPALFKEKWIEGERFFLRSFTIQPHEKRDEGVQRIAKNILTTIFCFALMGAAACLSFHLLPASMALSVAISSIYFIGKLFVHAEEDKKRFIASFAPQPKEPHAKYRILITALKAVAVGASALSAIAIGAYVIAPLFTHFSWSVKLPFQTKPIVFLEYAMVGLLHFGIATQKFRKGERSQAIFHLASAALSLMFPIHSWNGDMRLHHSFYGLLFMALPFRAMQWIGTIITFDASLYWISPLRGYRSTCGRFIQYDFINSIVDHFSLFWNTHVASVITQDINN